MERTAVDLFCGSGGLSLGMAMAGFEVLAGIDGWDAAVRTYRDNYPSHEGIHLDLSHVRKTYYAVKRFKPMLIAGGPPCQDFSIAGKRDEGDRADLTVKFAHVVRGIRPLCFLMENVPHASTSDAYQQARRLLSGAGYGITLATIDAAACGVPQSRKRLFMIGMLGERDGFLDMALSAAILDGRPTTMRDYFGSRLGFEHYYRHPRTYGRRAIYSIDEPCPTIRGVSRPKPSNYRRHEGDSADPSEVRALCPMERALIQSFPESYLWPQGATKATLELLIGNAVPPKMAERVCRVLYDHIEARMPSEEPRYADEPEPAFEFRMAAE